MIGSGQPVLTRKRYIFFLNLLKPVVSDLKDTFKKISRHNTKANILIGTFSFRWTVPLNLFYQKSQGAGWV
jgi:hypothetical protein